MMLRLENQELNVTKYYLAKCVWKRVYFKHVTYKGLCGGGTCTISRLLLHELVSLI